jgi:hypothetical protein
MDRLPQEVIDRIASFTQRLPDQSGIPWRERIGLRSTLPAYATISRSWKHAIERIVFQEISLMSTKLDTFDAILRADRRRLLKTLILNVVLPTYDEKACGRFEQAADEDANNESFTKAIEKLMAVLKSWEDDSVDSSLCFVLGNIYSPSDASEHDFETLQQQRFEVDVGQRHDLFEHRYMRKRIRLLRSDSLPSLNRVTIASFSHSTIGRYLDMRAVVDLTAKFPNIESCDCELTDNERRYPDLRLTNRHSFASALSSLTFPFLKTARLTFYHEYSLNQRIKPANLLGDDTCDPLSTALRSFSQSQNLTPLILAGVFDSSLFWPPLQQPSNSPVPSWPNLKSLTVTFDITTPSGHWYFTDQSGSDPEDTPTLTTDDDDSDYSDDSFFIRDEESFDEFDPDEDARLSGDAPADIFRNKPNPFRLKPLILAFAKALRQMPSLLTSTLTTGPLHGPDGNFQFDICYYAPGQTAYYGDEDLDDQNFRRLYFEVGDWDPDEEVMEVLRKVGRDRWAGGLIERFLESQY